MLLLSEGISPLDGLPVLLGHSSQPPLSPVNAILIQCSQVWSTNRTGWYVMLVQKLHQSLLTTVKDNRSPVLGALAQIKLLDTFISILGGCAYTGGTYTLWPNSTFCMSHRMGEPAGRQLQLEGTPPPPPPPPAEAPAPGPAKAMTAVSRVLIREVTSGSGSPCWAHSRLVWVEAKQILHLRARIALPVKHMEYRVVLIADHFRLPVSAAWRLKATFYLTQARPSKSWLTWTMSPR